MNASDLQRELDIHGRAFENTAYDLEFLDSVQRVLPRCMQWHPCALAKQEYPACSCPYLCMFANTVRVLCCLILCLHYNCAVNETVISCNFLRIEGRKFVRVEIPLEFFNAEKCDGSDSKAI